MLAKLDNWWTSSSSSDCRDVAFTLWDKLAGQDSVSTLRRSTWKTLSPVAMMQSMAELVAHTSSIGCAARFQMDSSCCSWDICSLAPPVVGCLFLISCFSFHTLIFLIWTSYNVPTCHGKPCRWYEQHSGDAHRPLSRGSEPASTQFFPPIVLRSFAPSRTSSV